MRTHTLLNNWLKAILLSSIAIIGFSETAVAGEEQWSNHIDVEPGSANDTIIITDDKFGNATQWATIDETVFVNNLLLFEVNEHGRKIITAPSTFTATIELGLWYAGDNPMAEPSDTIMEILQFTYDPNTAVVTPYRRFKNYNGAHKMRIIVKSVLSSMGGPLTAPDLRISGEIHLKRFYKFNQNSYPQFNETQSTIAKYGRDTIDWHEMIGAEMYDLEWVHFDKESVVGAQIAAGGLVEPDRGYGEYFRNNSTRVTVAANFYTLNLLYRQGYLLFRVRGVRPKDGLREHSVWNHGDNNGPYFIEVAQRENGINWQSSVVYAEEGKHIPSTQYFDGSMRNRQSVTLSNAIGRTIVGQTMYDYHGRPAVSVLPVPTEDSLLQYIPNFAMYDSDSAFTKGIWEAPICIEDAPRIDTLSPAGQYYSSNNPLKDTMENKFIPDGDGYTYTMTEYTPDLTGRIQTQSGVGEAFAMGNGHETRYYYAKPTQRELDRLFGTDVGNADHYLKNGVMDPNGQLSLSYIDGHGRVIATSLAGAKPDNVDTIDIGYVQPEVSTTDILYNQAQGNSLVSTYKFIVAAPGEHKFAYDMSSELYQDACTTICFDCKYDLVIELSRTDCKDIDGQSKIVKTLDNYDLSALSTECQTTSMSIADTDFTVDLDVGEYAITKRLTINEESLNYYTEEFLKEEACIPNLDSLKAEYVAAIDPESCDIDCDECVASLGSEDAYVEQALQLAADLAAQFDNLEDVPTISEADIRNAYREEVKNCMRPCESTTECEAIYGLLLADVSKGGQYGQFTVDPETGAYSVTDQTSVFYSNGHQTLEEGRIYREEDGSPSYVFDIAGNRRVPTELDLATFLQSWKPSWAEALVTKHPEYCIYLNWCLDPEYAAAEAWEDEIRGVDSYDTAISLGIFDPTNETFNDPFFIEGGLGFDCKANIDAQIEHLIPDEMATPGLIDLAIDRIYGADDDCQKALGSGTTAQNDATWEIIKNVYLGLRQQYVSKSRQGIIDSVCTGPPIHACIGGDCGSDNDYAEKAPRFYNTDYTGEPMDTTTAKSIRDETIAEIELDCQSRCESYADSWMFQLEGCLSGIDDRFRATTEANLRRKLIAVCQSGCDFEHPFGASTTPNGELSSEGDSSFEDILEEVFGNNCDIDCNPYVITGIYPYDVEPYRGGTTLAAQEMADDDCMCGRIDELELCYTNDDQGYTSFVDYLGQYSNIAPDSLEIAQLKAYCTRLAGTDPCEARPIEVELPAVLDCGVCQDCDAIEALQNTFDTNYGCSTDDPLYYGLLTKFLNYHLGWTQLEEDYTDFLEKCQNPIVCEVSTVLCPISSSLTLEVVDPCTAALTDQAIANAESDYTRLLEEARKQFIEGYRQKCLANMSETLDATLLTHEYHYTLYYYDQAGNLVQTVPPNGVNPITNTTQLRYIDELRRQGRTVPVLPQHSFFTKYKYNSLNQVTQQISPDTDLKEFFYDAVGRLIVSQDGRQRELYDDDLLDNILPDSVAYSYTIYDDLGRIIEVGEKTTTTPFTENTDFDTWLAEGALESRTHVTRTYYDEQPDFGMAAINIDDAANLRTRVAAVTIESVYDGDDATYDYGTHYSYDASGNVQTLVQEIVELEDIGHRYKRMDYDYDYISGNVNAVYYQRGKADQFTHRYTYDANNRLSEVYTSLVHDHANPAGLNVLLWDRDAAYEYYDHGPLSRVEIGEYRIQGMDYAYTLQGWIKGVNSSGLRADKDMGRDGFINEAGDMDPPNGGVARDALAYSLNYYQEDGLRDFEPISTDDPMMSLTNSSLQAAAPSLYNGNIRHMTIHNKQLGDPIAYSYKYDQLHRIKGMESHGNADLEVYQWGASDNGPANYSMATSYDGNGNILKMLRTGIKEEQRAPSEISNIDYKYEAGTNKLVGTMDTIKCDPEIYVPAPVTDNTTIAAGERLIASSVVDGSATVVFQAEDIVCLEPGFEVEAISPGTFVAQNEACQTKIENATYVYDGTGNLIKNATGANISWSPYGKVLAVTKEDDTQVVSFGYDPAQNRLKKSVVNTATNINKDVYYIRDASGNTMGVYERSQVAQVTSEGISDDENAGSGTPLESEAAGGVFTWKEQYLYGSSRLGGIKPLVEWTTTLPDVPTYTDSLSLGWKYYEAGNHLGNVLSVASDRKVKVDSDGDNEANYFEATILSATDYYPFGMDMPSRSFANAEYRYGFNGKEKDPGVEWGDGNHYDYGFRIYNPELGKFLSVDPLTREYPWYTPYQFAGNMPIWAIDLDGLEPVKIHTYSFAPFETFGGGYCGDGEDRCFGDEIIQKDREENFRIGGTVTLNLTGDQELKFDPLTTTSVHSWTGVKAQSPTQLQEPLDYNDRSYLMGKNVRELWFQIQGNDKAFNWGINPGYIDVKVDIQFVEKGNNLFSVAGKVYGDRFPANETYLEDKSGNKIFLGVSAPDVVAGHAPFHQLLGLAFDGMSKFGFDILFDDNDNFAKVILRNGTEFSLDEWNAQFTDLQPRDQNVGTKVTKSKVETDYDPNY